MNLFKRFSLEIYRVSKVLPLCWLLRWLCCLLLRMPQVVLKKSLGPVDDAFGTQFVVKQNGKLLKFDSCAFGVVREIFGAECYGGAESFSGLNTIVDFGANAGVFTIFALGSDSGIKVTAVETQPELIDALNRNLKANHFEERCTIVNAFVGEATTEWATQFRSEHPAIKSLDVDRLFENFDKIDFLKCDIEGAEFSLFSDALEWSSKIMRMSIEYHWNREDGMHLETLIRNLGFQTQLKDHGSLGYVIADRNQI